MALPERIDVRRWCATDETLTGSLNLSVFQRLAEYQAHPESELEYRLQFLRDKTGRYFLRLNLRANLALTCQRCMQPLDYSLNVDQQTQLVADETEAEAALAEQDPVTIPEDRAELLTVIEDECLLALPIVPKHEVCEAEEVNSVLQTSEQETQPLQRENPFAELADLRDSLRKK